MINLIRWQTFSKVHLAGFCQAVSHGPTPATVDVEEFPIPVDRLDQIIDIVQQVSERGLALPQSQLSPLPLADIFGQPAIS